MMGVELKKRVWLKFVVALSLCVLILLCSCGSDAEPPAEEPVVEKQLGIFYTETGIPQNTVIRLVISEDVFIEPLIVLSYSVRNDSDFDIVLNNTEDVFIELYCDGQWGAPPASDGDEVRDHEGEDEPKRLPANTSWPLIVSDTMYPKDFWVRFGKNLRANYPHYKELTAGLYRLRIPCIFQDPPADAAITEFELVAYFTVEPAAQ